MTLALYSLAVLASSSCLQPQQPPGAFSTTRNQPADRGSQSPLPPSCRTAATLHGNPPAKPSHTQSTHAWENFFQVNEDLFFKDRHWFEAEHPTVAAQFRSGPATSVLELGCGCGNAALPLIAAFPSVHYLGVDGSARAVELLCQDARFDPARCAVRAADCASDAFEPSASAHDVCLLIFVLSAMTPPQMERAVAKAAHSLKKGGKVVFRDYATGDLAQMRFRRSARLARNLYARSDGTLSFFFSEPGLEMLFKPFFDVCFMSRLCRIVVNREQNKEMHRWFLSMEATKR
jgi:SAM-dependent methyltransferase